MNIRSHPLKERLLMCERFAKTISQPDRTELTPIRCKELTPIMSSYKLKDGQVRPVLVTSSSIDTKTDRFYVPRGLLFLNELKPSLRKRIDKRTGRHFFVALSRKNKCFFQEELPNPNLIYASFKSSFVGRQFWKWDLITQTTFAHFVTESKQQVSVPPKSRYDNYEFTIFNSDRNSTILAANDFCRDLVGES